MSRIRFAKRGTLLRPTVNEDGQTVVPPLASGTNVSLAFWRRKLLPIVGGVGESRQVDATAFFPSGTDVQRRDWLAVSGVTGRFVVAQVVPADDDRARLDHFGAQLRLASGVG